jgi:CubicO group peptidase (beta-lactamase class C family)
MKLRKSLAVLILSLLAFVAFQPVAFGQATGAINTAAIDVVVQDALKAWQAPGAAVVIVKGDEVAYMKGFGVKEAGTSQAVTPDTLFAIASTSKAFTTTALAMLVDDGKMSWDDPVSKHIDFFHLSDPLTDRNVTLRDLVTHRTGLSRNDMLWLGSPWGREEIIRRIGFVKLSQPFRSTYQYQNIMFLTAGYAVGKASGSSWEEFTRKRIFEPLGMKGANFSTNDATKAADHATPHVRGPAGKVSTTPWRNIDNVGPAGSINAGVRDLSQWLRFQLSDGTFNGKRLLSAALLDEMHSPQMVIRLDGTTGVTAFTKAMNPETTMMSYGLGWTIQDYRGQLLVSHGGSIDGFRAQVALLPKHKFGIAILSNLGRTSLPEAVRNNVVDVLLGLSKKDWDAHYLAQMAKAEATEKAREKKFEASRKKDTKPSRELSAYTGTFEDPAYGEAKVSLDGDGLLLEWSSFRLRLEHWHYDTFVTKGDPLVNHKPVMFTLAADGDVEKLSFLEQEFKRKASGGR